MATLKQIEANRRNAQKSTGPRTEAGKEIARQNALKHGMRSSEFSLLPSEDPAEYADRLDAWINDYQPTDETELQLVTQAVTLTWKIDRANRHEAAFLANQVRAAIEPIRYKRREWVTGAIDRLIPSVDRTQRYGIEPAAKLIDEFEQTAEGCRRLLEEWQLLRRLIENATVWSTNREFTAMRLLGQGPGTISDREAVALIIAARVLRAAAEEMDSASIDPDQWAQDKGLRVVLDREVVRELWADRPKDAPEAFLVLMVVVERESARLGGLMAERESRFDPVMAEAADLVSFDPSPEGERVRRYLASLQRELLKTLDMIGRRRQLAIKLRLDEAKLRKVTNEANLAGSGDLPGRAVGVSPLSGSNNEGGNARQDERTQFDRPSDEDRVLTPPARQDDRTQFDRPSEEDRGLTPPARQDMPPARQDEDCANEPNSAVLGELQGGEMENTRTAIGLSCPCQERDLGV